jgi:hypothetical protein
MGTELAQATEWNHDASLDWHLVNEPRQRGLLQFMRDLGRVYNERAPLWRRDHEPEGFSWIDVADRDNSVISYVRRDGPDHVVVVLNLTPIPREDYLIGAPAQGTYVQLLSSDDAAYGFLDLMALRVPVLAERSAMAQRYVADGIGGILLPPNDAPTTAAMVTGFLADEERRAAMGNAAHVRVARDFRADEMVDAFARVTDAARDRTKWVT